MPERPETISLPAGFEEFGAFSAWALPRQTERRHRRIHESTYEDLEALYSFGMEADGDGRTRIERALEYLNQFPLDSVPEDARHLFWILLSMAEVSVSVECWKEVIPSEVERPERFPPTERTDLL